MSLVSSTQTLPAARDEPTGESPNEVSSESPAGRARPTAVSSVVALLALSAIALVWLEAPGPLRAAIVAAALGTAPGYAALPRKGTIDPWAKAGIVVSLSIATETVLALVMIWTGFWHPLGAGAALMLISANVVVLRDLVSWSRAHSATPGPHSVTAVPAPFDQRVMAHLVDLAVPLGMVAALVVVLAAYPSAQLALLTLGTVLITAWLATAWWMSARHRAGLGLRLMGLRVVDVMTGEPLGWRRSLNRTLALLALEASAVGGVLMLVHMIREPRRRGWPDQLTDAVVLSHPTVAEPGLATPPADRRRRSGPVRVPNWDEPAASVAPVGWLASLDDGRQLAVTATMVIGRDPEGVDGQTAVSVADDTRTVSRTHLLLGVDAQGLFVVDQGSANGTSVTNLSGQTTRCTPNSPVRVGHKNIVSFGKHWLEARDRSQP